MDDTSPSSSNTTQSTLSDYSTDDDVIYLNIESLITDTNFTYNYTDLSIPFVSFPTISSDVIGTY